eukprot:CAMPEP_0119008844 /NCGR_PEP_ID=MMETSP1176-20130426/3982_1 /TAXON_ID=265551 /ORGANISM="Synedropsis recta cf, Strain CCMP1620" /LENGTH=391 /DNA_ID=CAMNT_0006961253 /DNA_START=49 /DNA_END=1224 /DNA_ORIENTATION=-
MSSDDNDQEEVSDAPPVQDEQAPPIRKTWGAPTVVASSGGSGGSQHVGGTAEKKSLLSIMAEEQEKEESNRASKRLGKETLNRYDQEEQALQEALQASLMQDQNNTNDDDDDDDLTMDDETRRAILLSTMETTEPPPTTVAASLPQQEETNTETAGISAEELEAIENALREADDAETAKSFQLALSLHTEETSRGGSQSLHQSVGSAQLKQGNVRTVTRAEYMREQEAAIQGDAITPAQSAYHGNDDDDDDYHEGEAGFRLNSSKQSSQWNRLDQGSVIGPNNEVRTKHDIELQSQANAYRLSLDLEQDSVRVGNKAFNSFKRSVQKTNNSKGGAGQKKPPGTPSAKLPPVTSNTAVEDVHQATTQNDELSMIVESATNLKPDGSPEPSSS